MQLQNIAKFAWVKSRSILLKIPALRILFLYFISRLLWPLAVEGNLEATLNCPPFVPKKVSEVNHNKFVENICVTNLLVGYSDPRFPSISPEQLNVSLQKAQLRVEAPRFVFSLRFASRIHHVEPVILYESIS